METLANGTEIFTKSIDQTKRLKGKINGLRTLPSGTYYNVSDITVFDEKTEKWVKDEYDYGILRLPSEITVLP